MKSVFRNPHNRPNLDREAKLVLQVAGLIGLMVLCADANAAVFNFPIIDNILCGFIDYCRGKLAPSIATIVIIFSVVGHWLGTGKMWGTLLNVGLGLGVIVGIGSMVANFTNVGNSCLIGP